MRGLMDGFTLKLYRCNGHTSGRLLEQSVIIGIGMNNRRRRY